MNILIILANPNPESFNHAIAAACVEELSCRGHRVTLHDLYAEQFDPILPRHEIPRNATLPETISRHCQELVAADGLIIIHPNWWGMPPAILKGWVDRVIRPGVAYEFIVGDSGEGVPNGLLRTLQAVILFNTSNTEVVRELKVFGDPLETIWKNCILGLCGVTNFYRKMFSIIVTSSKEQRSEWLDDVRSLVSRVFPS